MRTGHHLVQEAAPAALSATGGAALFGVLAVGLAAGGLLIAGLAAGCGARSGVLDGEALGTGHSGPEESSSGPMLQSCAEGEGES
jgi:hypothetical protein